MLLKKKISIGFVILGFILLLSSLIAIFEFVNMRRTVEKFVTDDIISIKDPKGQEIGVGRTSYDSAEARKVIGHHSKKPLIHYDYLYIK